MENVLTLLTDAADVAPHILVHDFLRYILAAGATFLLVEVLFSRAFVGRRIRSDRPPFGQALREILISLRTVLIFAGSGMMIWTGARFGFFHIYDDPGAYGWAYFVFSLVLLIVLHDAWFYWTHRLIHHPKLFPRLHRTHHRSMNPTPFTAYSFDVGEAFIHAAYLPIILAIIPVAQLAALIWALHMIVRNVIGHCGYELLPRSRSGKPLFDWLTSVTHHDLHHANFRYNNGLYFTWWDRLMGTEHPQYHLKFAETVMRGNRKSQPRLLPLPAPLPTPKTSKIAASLLVVFVAIAAASCSADGVRRTGYETLQNVGRQQCLNDPGRNPADCYNRQSYDDYRNEQDAPAPEANP